MTDRLDGAVPRPLTNKYQWLDRLLLAGPPPEGDGAPRWPGAYVVAVGAAIIQPMDPPIGKGFCSLANERIAERAQCTGRQVRTAIRALEYHSCISRTHRPGYPAIIRLEPDAFSWLRGAEQCSGVGRNTIPGSDEGAEHHSGGAEHHSGGAEHHSGGAEHHSANHHLHHHLHHHEIPPVVEASKQASSAVDVGGSLLARLRVCSPLPPSTGEIVADTLGSAYGLKPAAIVDHDSVLRLVAAADAGGVSAERLVAHIRHRAPLVTSWPKLLEWMTEQLRSGEHVEWALDWPPPPENWALWAPDWSIGRDEYSAAARAVAVWERWASAACPSAVSTWEALHGPPLAREEIETIHQSMTDGHWEWLCLCAPYAVGVMSISPEGHTRDWSTQRQQRWSEARAMTVEDILRLPSAEVVADELERATEVDVVREILTDVVENGWELDERWTEREPWHWRVARAELFAQVDTRELENAITSSIEWEREHPHHVGDEERTDAELSAIVDAQIAETICRAADELGWDALPRTGSGHISLRKLWEEEVRP